MLETVDMKPYFFRGLPETEFTIFYMKWFKMRWSSLRLEESSL